MNDKREFIGKIQCILCGAKDWDIAEEGVFKAEDIGDGKHLIKECVCHECFTKILIEEGSSNLQKF